MQVNYIQALWVGHASSMEMHVWELREQHAYVFCLHTCMGLMTCEFTIPLSSVVADTPVRHTQIYSCIIGIRMYHDSTQCVYTDVGHLSLLIRTHVHI